MNNIQIFQNEQFGQVRIAMNESNEPVFCLADVAKALGYSRPADAVNQHCKGVVVLPTPTNGGIQEIKYGKESEVYRLTMKSKLPDAEKFQDWVCDEVLPSIRKYGAYMTSDTLEKALTSPDFLIQLATNLKEEQQKRIEAEQAKQKTQILLEQKTEQLDESQEWYSIKRWAKEHHMNWRSIDWRKLKAISYELGYEIKKIFDGNYGQVNIYHRRVFEAY